MHDGWRAAKRKAKGAGNPGKPGKKLRLEDLQSQFGVGLKEAANRLGICPTTLKVYPWTVTGYQIPCLGIMWPSLLCYTPEPDSRKLCPALHQHRKPLPRL